MDRIDQWLNEPEGRNLEFKEARSNFHFEKLVKYTVALANEGGGHILLGVTDMRPRKIVGSSAFSDLERTEQGIVDRIHLKVRAEEFHHPDGRVVIFHIPPRPIGVPIQYKGAYWMRAGDALKGMTPDMLRAIFAETAPDFSAEICQGAKLEDLDPEAIEEFRKRWIRRSGNRALESLPDDQLLEDAELLIDGQVTFAALVLFGKRRTLGKFLSQCEIIFEFRSSTASTSYQQREEFRQGFLTIYDGLWERVNLRNDQQQYREGLFAYEIPTFDEDTIREALLNAVCHRDYQLSGSIFVRQYPKYIVVTNPGGFPSGVTPENILDRQNPRNRRIAEAFSRCGLVERSGQGVDRMFKNAIRQAKSLPSFGGSDDFQVQLTLQGEVQDPAFLRFLERVGDEKLASFDTHDFLVLDAIQREKPIPESLLARIPRLREIGVIESVGRGKGVRRLLSRRFYQSLGKIASYTRRKGLDHETNKSLLEKHLQNSLPNGCALEELQQVVPHVSRSTVQRMLRELRGENRVELKGKRRWGRWFSMRQTTGNDL